MPLADDMDAAWQHYQQIGRERGYFPGPDYATNHPLQTYLSQSFDHTTQKTVSDQVNHTPDGKIYVTLANGTTLDLTDTLWQIKNHPKGLLPVTVTMEYNDEDQQRKVWTMDLRHLIEPQRPTDTNVEHTQNPTQVHYTPQRFQNEQVSTTTKVDVNNVSLNLTPVQPTKTPNSTLSEPGLLPCIAVAWICN